MRQFSPSEDTCALLKRFSLKDAALKPSETPRHLYTFPLRWGFLLLHRIFTESVERHRMPTWKCFQITLLYNNVHLYIMYPSSSPLFLLNAPLLQSCHLKDQTAQSSAASLLPNPCSLRGHYIQEDWERKKARLETGWKSQCVFVCIYMIKRENGGGMAAFSSPITSRQALSQSQSQLRRELVSMEMTLEWCWCLLIAEEAARWAVGQAHTRVDTHTRTHTLRRHYHWGTMLPMTYGDVIAEYNSGM